MADLNMDNYAIKLADNKVDPSKQNAKKKAVYDKYTLLAELAVNDELPMNLIPEGALILDAGVKIGATLGASGILDMGLKSYVNRAGTTVAEDQDSLIQQADGGGQAVYDHSGIGAVAIGSIVGKGGAQPFLKCTELSTAGTGVLIQAYVEYLLP